MMMKFRLTIIILLIGGIFTFANATVKLPPHLSDNMVLQQNKPIKVWGTAEKGEVITVTFNNQRQKAKTDTNGFWKTKFKPMKFGGPYKMMINGKSEKIVLKNILIGDVWLCSGQSNMEWSVKNSKDAQVEIKNANYPNIRLLSVQVKVSNYEKKAIGSTGWQVCNSQSVPDFSAIAYYFGRQLYSNLHIPIGLINSSCGATSIETWSSGETMGSFDEYKSKVEESKLQSVTQRIENHESVYPNEYPALLYNSMIAPLTCFPIKGVIWYQGESNVHNPEIYSRLFISLIKDWRKKWGEKNLPFHYIQLPNFSTKTEDKDPQGWIKIREAQHKALKLRATNEVVTIDIGNPTNIHPVNKQDFANRLAKSVMSKTYNKGNSYSGAIFKSMKIEGNKAILSFTHVGEKPVSENSNGQLNEFYIAGKDRQFKRANASIKYSIKINTTF